MENIYWHKQSAVKPLFDDLLWAKPQNRRTAGKLLIIGGSAHGFAAPAEAYRQSENAGVGTVRVLLPDATRKLVGGFIESTHFGASGPSGSFSKQALGELLTQATWANGVLLAGDLGRNSETAIVLEKFLSDYKGPLTLTKDAVDYFKHMPTLPLTRSKTTLVMSLAQLQSFATVASFSMPITFKMDLLHLVESLSAFSQKYTANIIVKHLDNIVVAVGGQISTTRLGREWEIWRVKTAAYAAVWWAQNPTKAFEALSTAVYATMSDTDGAAGRT